MHGKRTTKLCGKFERSQRFNSLSGGLRKLPDGRNWHVTKELDGEMNVIWSRPSGLYTCLFFQLLKMNGELLFEIFWKINRTENPPCVAHDWVLARQFARSDRRRMIVAFVSRCREDFFDGANTRKHARSLDRHENHFRVIRARHVAKTFDVSGGDQVLCWVALPDCRPDPGDRFRLRFGGSQTRLSRTFSL